MLQRYWQYVHWCCDRDWKQSGWMSTSNQMEMKHTWHINIMKSFLVMTEMIHLIISIHMTSNLCSRHWSFSFARFHFMTLTYPLERMVTSTCSTILVRSSLHSCGSDSPYWSELVLTIAFTPIPIRESYVTFMDAKPAVGSLWSATFKSILNIRL